MSAKTKVPVKVTMRNGDIFHIDNMGRLMGLITNSTMKVLQGEEAKLPAPVVAFRHGQETSQPTRLRFINRTAIQSIEELAELDG